MKRITFILFALLLFALPAQADEDDEISLFNSSGKPIAYFADNLTIYLWVGKPVAYLKKGTGRGLSIYGFNGKHLGWLMGKVIYDHEGHPVGATKDAFAGAVEFEPFKGFKQFEPFKSFTEFEPLQRLLRRDWSETSLKMFLMLGIAD